MATRVLFFAVIGIVHSLSCEQVCVSFVGRLLPPALKIRFVHIAEYCCSQSGTQRLTIADACRHPDHKKPALEGRSAQPMPLGKQKPRPGPRDQIPALSLMKSGAKGHR